MQPRANGMFGMRGVWAALAVFGLALALPALGADRDRPQGTNAPSPFSYPAFRVIPERNIFNAARSGRTPSGPPREARRPTRTESFALVGTMAYEKGTFAFFDGSDSAHRKVLQVGGSIAGFQVVSVQSKSVRLEGGGKTLDLAVNSSMRREDEGEWRISDRTESSEGGGSDRGRSDSRSSGSPAASSASSGELSEVLKRLMEQREKEMK